MSLSIDRPINSNSVHHVLHHPPSPQHIYTAVRFLANLLLEHGRFNYRRTSTVIKYIFYKNCLLVLPQFFFGIFSAFSGQNFYNDVYYQVNAHTH